MRMIRIVSVPPGQAPEWVREQWVGLELPIIEEEQSGMQTGVLGGGAQNIGGFRVDGLVAIKTLEAKSPKAVSWWKENAPAVISNQLVFKKEVCQLI